MTGNRGFFIYLVGMIVGLFFFQVSIFAYTVKIWNGTHEVFVPDKTIELRWLSANIELATSTVQCDASGQAVFAVLPGITPDVLEMALSYLGNDFFAHTSITSSEQIVTLSVYDPDYQPDKLRIKLMHMIVSGMDKQLIFDVRLIVSNLSRFYSVSANYGFSFPFFSGAALLGSNPQATVSGNQLFFAKGLRPGENFLSYTFSLPFQYSRTYEYPIRVTYPVDNLLVVGDAFLDVNAQGAVVQRQIKTMNDVSVAYFTARNLVQDMVIIVSPVKNRHFFIWEVLTGMLLVALILGLIKLKNRPVPSYHKLVENITNKEKYNNEIDI